MEDKMNTYINFEAKTLRKPNECTRITLRITELEIRKYIYILRFNFILLNINEFTGNNE